MSIVESQTLARFYQPRDLAALIDLYESNFIRLMQLMPELDQISGTVVSRVSGAHDLYLTVLERHKYTTSLNLTYSFGGSDDWMLEPNARICVYHDVRAAEILSSRRRRRVRRTRPWVRGRLPELNRKWDFNRFLLKWLKFCTHQGHMFLGCTTARAPELDAHVRANSPRITD